MRPPTARRHLVGYTALAATDAWLSGRPEPLARRARWLTKPALVPTAAVRLGRSGRKPLRSAALLGLAAGWAGDVALLGRGNGAFLTGLSCFAAGHAAYVTGMRQHRALPRPRPRPATVAPAAVAALLAPALAGAAERHRPGLRLPVLGYAALLAGTAIAAADLDPALPPAARRRLVAGSWLFLVSDGVLGARTFVMEPPTPLADRAVMATYSAAQWLLASGASRLQT